MPLENWMSPLRVLVDADACPVKEEVYRVAYRRGVPVRVDSACSMTVSMSDGSTKAADGSMQVRLEPLPEMPDYLKQVIEEMG